MFETFYKFYLVRVPFEQVRSHSWCRYHQIRRGVTELEKTTNNLVSSFITVINDMYLVRYNHPGVDIVTKVGVV